MSGSTIYWVLKGPAQKGVKKGVIFDPKMVNFDPFWTPFLTGPGQVRATLYVILLGFGPGPVKRGQKGVPGGSKKALF